MCGFPDFKVVEAEDLMRETERKKEEKVHERQNKPGDPIAIMQTQHLPKTRRTLSRVLQTVGQRHIMKESSFGVTEQTKASLVQAKNGILCSIPFDETRKAFANLASPLMQSSQQQ